MSQERNTQRRRRLSARSLVASTLLGCHPPQLPVRALLRIGKLYGIAEGTIRVALSRMVATGEVQAVGNDYRLTGGQLLGRQARQEEGWRPTLQKWDGTWSLAVVVADNRTASDRGDLRQAMDALRLAELREGVWTRPDNLPRRRLPSARSVVDTQCKWFQVLPPGSAGSKRLSKELWDLRAWASYARELRRRLGQTVRQLEDGDYDSLATAGLTSAATLRHFNADPLLPSDLLPARWPGDLLRTDYDRFEMLLRQLLREWTLERPG